MGTKKGRERFAREAPISHLIGVDKWFNDHAAELDIEIIFQVKCDDCGKMVEVESANGDGLHGCGGIVAEYNRILCESCACCAACEDD